MPPAKPFENTRLAKFLDKRILELRPRKSQAQIASEAGFRNPNVLTMFKQGSNKVPLDRVHALAKALECDPRLLFQMALEQSSGDTTERAVREIFGTIVSRNEVAWIEEIRDASGHSDPALTSRARHAIRSIFGK